MKPITLSSEARRKIGGKFVPRQRQPGEVLPPERNLFERPILTRADFGSAPPMRPGANDAMAIPSRGPFRGGAL